jgi:2-haloalkanoic acid dehalogenase type II
MSGPRALLLDFYGTLVHEDTKVVEAICQEVSRNAPAASPAEVARTWWSAFGALTTASHGPGFRLQRDLARMSLTDTVRHHESASDPGLLLEAQFAYWQRPQIHPDTRNLLAAALPACVVSNIDRADLAAALAHHELGGHFTHVVTSQDARAYKPRPEMFTTALGLLGLGAHEVIHVGDSLTSDVVGAARLGIPVAWVNRERRPAPGTGPRPTYEVTDLSELLALLDG